MYFNLLDLIGALVTAINSRRPANVAQFYMTLQLFLESRQNVTVENSIEFRDELVAIIVQLANTLRECDPDFKSTEFYVSLYHYLDGGYFCNENYAAPGSL